MSFHNRNQNFLIIVLIPTAFIIWFIYTKDSFTHSSEITKFFKNHSKSYNNVLNSTTNKFYQIIKQSIIKFKDLKSKSSSLPYNYVKSISQVNLALKESDLIVNTSNCKIPYLNPWDPVISKFFGHPSTDPVDCSQSNSNWSGIVGNTLVMYSNNMKRDGYNFTENFCCYKIIQRKEQDLEGYDMEADRLYKISSCIPILRKHTKISAEFISVECQKAYIGLHASAYSADPSKYSHKIKHWRKRHKNKSRILPPNILIIGQDSTSRINFQRQMNKTKSFLSDELGAVEMLGFTKVGDNTLGNLCVMLSGYTPKEIKEICGFSTKTKADDCPWIWKRFDKEKYLTGFTEDSPNIGTFNYQKVGFVQQPTDFYTRPLFYAAEKTFGFQDCVGELTYDELITSILETQLELAVKKQSPIFAISWSSTVFHDDMNGLQTVDETYYNFLKRIQDKGYLDNTILILMGDHGYRYGAYRLTRMGNFEDKLPNMWIRLPPKVKERYPEWQRALEINSKRVTSLYTMYWTFHLILDTFTKTNKPKDALALNESNKTLHRKFGNGNSFFTETGESNSCEDVGVPGLFCVCPFPMQEVKLNDPTLKRAANYIVEWINKKIVKSEKTGCVDLRLEKIFSASSARMQRDGFLELLRYNIGFKTSPGSYLYEGSVDYFPGNESFSENIQTQRISHLDASNFDGLDIKDSLLELYCNNGET